MKNFYVCIDNVYGSVSSVWTEEEYFGEGPEMANFSWEEIAAETREAAYAQLRAEGRY